MTTQSWSTVVDHSTDAAFRTWGLELNTKLAAAGLVNNNDTGSINWTTVTRAAINTNAGFEVWKLNDSLFGTAPIYIRIDYGTNGATAGPRLQFTVGTATNGSGTLSGTALTTARVTGGNSAPTSTSTAYQSYCCVAEGFFGLAWKGGSSGTQNIARCGFWLFRTVDSTGAITATGATVLWANGAASGFTAMQDLRFAATANAYTAITTNANFPCVVPGYGTSSLDASGNIQCYLWYGHYPTVLPSRFMCTTFLSEVSAGSTFSVALVGSSSHTYISVGGYAPGEPNATGATWAPCMLWE